jgi:hypothetical protein
MANSEREDEDEDPPKVWIKKDEMKEIWNLCKDDFNFFFGFQTQLTSELQDRRTEPSDANELKTTILIAATFTATRGASIAARTKRKKRS